MRRISLCPMVFFFLLLLRDPWSFVSNVRCDSFFSFFRPTLFLYRNLFLAVVTFNEDACFVFMRFTSCQEELCQ